MIKNQKSCLSGRQNFKNVKLGRLLTKSLLLVLLLGVFGCQKDDSFDAESHQGGTKGGHEVSIQKLALNDLNQIQSLNKPLHKMKGLLDVDKASGTYSRLTTTDGTITVLTDEIVELATANSVSYSFLTETPLNPHADFENLVLYQRGGGPFRFYLYSYKALFVEGQWNNYVISRLEMDGESLGLGSLEGALGLRTLWSGGCLWNISQSGNEIVITLLWCPDGSGTGDIGGVGGGIGVPGNGAQPSPNDSCGEWVFSGSSGGNKCHWHKGCVDAYGNAYFHYLPGPCNGEGNGGDGTGSDDTGNNTGDGSDIYNDGPTGGGSGGGSQGNEEGETVGVNPPHVPRDFKQEIIDCFSGTGYLVNVSGLSFNQQRDLAQYLKQDTNNDPFDNSGTNCSDPQALVFAFEAIEAILEGGEVDFEENRINGIKLDSNLPPCTQNMLLDLMLGNFPYSDTMGNIELINSTFEILGGSYSSSPMGFVTTYKVGEIDGNGQTSPAELDSEGVYQVTVTISENLVENGTKLALIKTILHESIHAYLRYVAKQYPLLFTDPDGEFSTLVAGWQEYQNNNDAHHLYMAELVSEMALNVSNFIQEKYGYPASTTEYYEAVCWSGITHLANGSLNPVFSDNFPNSDDQYHIIKVFNTENGTETYSGYEPLVDNNCN